MPSTQEQIRQQLYKHQKFDLFYWADIFLSEYGMNFEEFKKLNIQAFYLMREKMQKRYEEMNKQLEKSKRGRR